MTQPATRPDVPVNIMSPGSRMSSLVNSRTSQGLKMEGLRIIIADAAKFCAMRWRESAKPRSMADLMAVVDCSFFRLIPVFQNCLSLGYTYIYAWKKDLNHTNEMGHFR